MPNSSFEDLLKSLDVFPVLGKGFVNKDYVSLDLSSRNSHLESIDVSSSSEIESYIKKHVNRHNAKIAFGGYLEQRDIYSRSSHFNKQKLDTVRNIHLGIDLWIGANTLIYAPLDGEIHSFKNNTNFGDYGPTLILRHKIKDIIFYTLYGHLSVASLDDKSIGFKIKKGDQIATLGTAEVNGDYAPHLHFQIIKDIQEFNGDYPGVASKKDLDFYKINCPNPNLVLKLT